MNTYLPISWPVDIALIALFVLIAGFALPRLRTPHIARLLAWLILPTAVGLTLGVTSAENPGFRMLALVGNGLLGMKAIVAVEAERAGAGSLSPLRWLGFAVGWAGMRPSVFARTRSPNLEAATALSRRALLRIGAGLCLLVLARSLADAVSLPVFATVPLLIGLSLILHFGVLNLMCAGWRAFGVPTQPLFVAPHRAQSLTEFWGRRWNLAFSEMTSLVIFKPLVAHVGRPCALAAAFMFSGLLHEMAISFPVREGYGLPMAYFALHGGAMLAEDRLAQSGRGLTGWLGRVWTFGWLVVPLPLLFHVPFLRGVVWPLVGIEG